MRRSSLLALSVAALPMVLSGRATADWSLSTGGHLDLYQSDESSPSKGREVFAPLTLSYEADWWTARVSSGYVYSRFEASDHLTGEVRTFVDTTLSGMVRPKLFGGEMVAGVDVDLPSGDSRLSGTQRLAQQDPDLVLITNFGTGWNVNGHVNYARAFGPLTAGLGGGYQYHRKYDATFDIPKDDIEPGDQWTATGRLDWAANDFVRVGAQASYLHFGTDKRDGKPVFKVGPTWEVSTSLDVHPEPWYVSLFAKWTTTAKSELPTGTGGLATEPHRSSGDTVFGSVEAGYVLNDAWAFRGMVDVKHVFPNDYPGGDAFYDAGRTKVAVGPGVTWKPRGDLTVDLSVKGFGLWDFADPSTGRDTEYLGVHADLLVTFRF